MSLTRITLRRTQIERDAASDQRPARLGTVLSGEKLTVGKLEFLANPIPGILDDADNRVRELKVS